MEITIVTLVFMSKNLSPHYDSEIDAFVPEDWLESLVVSGLAGEQAVSGLHLSKLAAFSDLMYNPSAPSTDWSSCRGTCGVCTNNCTEESMNCRH